ncbi:MAG: esterase/lipase family protein [Candidatus Methylumidiphilus sp.]
MATMTAPANAGRCDTKYPIILLHGLGYRDDMFLLASWGRIPDVLRAEGAQVSLGGLDAWNTIENNVAQLKPCVDAAIAQTGAGKVNLIAHSKGGLEARYLISKLGMGTKVASLTTVCTPHRGTAVADLLAGDIPDRSGLLRFNLVHLLARKFGFKPFDFLARITGDKRPDADGAIRQLTRTFMDGFNQTVRDVPGVYYQSYGTAMKAASDDPMFAATHSWLLLEQPGENDGVVPAASCQWGNFRGFIAKPDPRRGISHADMVDYRGRLVKDIDIPAVYVGMVEELKQLGF